MFILWVFSAFFVIVAILNRATYKQVEKQQKEIEQLKLEFARLIQK